MAESQTTRTARALRLDFPPDATLADMQAALVLPEWTGLQPSTEIYKGETLVWQTNSLGLRSPEPIRGRKLAVIWGDSVIFGAPCCGGSWISELDGEFQMLNGGVPGSPLYATLDRMQRLNETVDIDLNIVVAGWYPGSLELGPQNAGLRDYLGQQAERCNGPVALATTPTSLNPAIVDHDLRIYSQDTPRFIWDFEPGVARAWLGGISERNEIVRDLGSELGLPVFDWFELMRTTSLDDFRTDFIDFGHFRSCAMPKVVAAWRDWLDQQCVTMPPVTTSVVSDTLLAAQLTPATPPS